MIKWLNLCRLTLVFFLLGPVIFLFIILTLAMMPVSSFTETDIMLETIKGPEVPRQFVLHLVAHKGDRSRHLFKD